MHHPPLRVQHFTYRSEIRCSVTHSVGAEAFSDASHSWPQPEGAIRLATGADAGHTGRRVRPAVATREGVQRCTRLIPGTRTLAPLHQAGHLRSPLTSDGLIRRARDLVTETQEGERAQACPVPSRAQGAMALRNSCCSSGTPSSGSPSIRANRVIRRARSDDIRDSRQSTTPEERPSWAARFAISCCFTLKQRLSIR
jgi:hypothetical protein